MCGGADRGAGIDARVGNRIYRRRIPNACRVADRRERSRCPADGSCPQTPGLARAWARLRAYRARWCMAEACRNGCGHRVGKIRHLEFRRRRRAGCDRAIRDTRSEEHTSELQSRLHLVCRLLLEKKKKSSIVVRYVEILADLV